jgi:hypothetical protein
MITSFPDYNQQATFRWVPWHCNFRKGWQRPMAWLHLGARGLVLSYGLGLEREERSILRLGQWLLSRPETLEEREERKEGEAEAAFMEHEANRYCEWSY